MGSACVDNFILCPKSALNPFIISNKHEGNISATGVTIKEKRNFGLVSLTVFKSQYEEFSKLIFSEFGINLPTSCAVSRSNQLIFISVAPGQWLALCEEGYTENLASKLEDIVGKTAAIVDLSDSRAIIEISGTKIFETLAKGISIDFHPSIFTAEQAVTTFAAQLAMTIWLSSDGETFNISVFRAFSASLLNWLIASAKEFGCNISHKSYTG
jgi:heterotetrameric sarcosine oxidase gamma subunit